MGISHQFEWIGLGWVLYNISQPCQVKHVDTVRLIRDLTIIIIGDMAGPCL